ncbi:MAG: hypothetical protein KIT14_22455 [bacterium]|nr:hypothetical protein [bacterium]
MRDLVPFPGDVAFAALRVRAGARRAGGVLRCVWKLDGARAGLHLPPPSAVPRRADRLWEETCCEAFVAPAAGAAYWELNLAPSGDWNLYRFSGYREDMRWEERVAGLVDVATTTTADGWRLEAGIDLQALPELAAAPLEVGLSVVLAGAGRSFRALAHPAARADFHDRAAFMLRLGAAA